MSEFDHVRRRYALLEISRKYVTRQIELTGYDATAAALVADLAEIEYEQLVIEQATYELWVREGSKTAATNLMRRPA